VVFAIDRLVSQLVCRRLTPAMVDDLVKDSEDFQRLVGRITGEFFQLFVLVTAILLKTWRWFAASTILWLIYLFHPRPAYMVAAWVCAIAVFTLLAGIAAMVRKTSTIPVTFFVFACVCALLFCTPHFRHGTAPKHVAMAPHP